MAAAAGIFNHAMTAAQALAGKAVTPADSSATGTSGTSNSSDASGDSATISANDFLTLLVTEMQNQDPTADTDPNEYINQLVEVNSLEQLISINQTLSTDLGTPATTSAGNTPSAQAAGTAASPAAASPSSTTGQAAAAVRSALSTTAPGAAHNPLAALRAPGNLSVPAADPSAQRVAHALDRRTHAPAVAGAQE